MVDRGVVPACGEMRVDGDGFGLGIDGDAKETAQGGRDDHGTRQGLGVGTPPKGTTKGPAKGGGDALAPGQSWWLVLRPKGTKKSPLRSSVSAPRSCAHVRLAFS